MKRAFRLRWPMFWKVVWFLEYDSRANTSWSPRLSAGALAGNALVTTAPDLTSSTLSDHTPAEERKIEIRTDAPGDIWG